MDKAEGNIKSTKEEKRNKIMSMVDELDEDEGEKPTMQLDDDSKKKKAQQPKAELTMFEKLTTGNPYGDEPEPVSEAQTDEDNMQSQIAV